MKDSIFIDTNIFVYAFLKNYKRGDDYQKHIKAKELLQSFEDSKRVVISTQVCNEYYSALLKNKISEQYIQDSLKALIEVVEVSAISKSTILKLMDLKNRYRYSYWDSLIISSALENGCSILYSEDMQHNQVIENQLKIVNPFVG